MKILVVLSILLSSSIFAFGGGGHAVGHASSHSASHISKSSHASHAYPENHTPVIISHGTVVCEKNKDGSCK